MTKNSSLVQLLTRRQILLTSKERLENDRERQRDINYSLTKFAQENRGKTMFPPVLPIGISAPNEVFTFQIQDSRFGYYFQKEFPDDNPQGYTLQQLGINSGLLCESRMSDSDLRFKLDELLRQNGVSSFELSSRTKEDWIVQNKEKFGEMLGIQVPEIPFNKVLYKFNLKSGSVLRLDMIKQDWVLVSRLKYAFIDKK